MSENERRETIDGIPIVRVKKIPEQKPSLLFDWDLTDSSYRPMRVKGFCDDCAQPLPCRWCNMAREFNVED
jgi:hypothetical protein